MFTIQSADKVLKSVYLDVVADQLNTATSPFYNMVEKNNSSISGKDAIAVARWGINGGVGSGGENAELPTSSSATLLPFKADLKNIYGTIEISDKALKASRNSAGALVNLLSNEMDSLLSSAKFNFNRMLYQNGTGILAKVVTYQSAESRLTIGVSSVKNLIEGMIIDIICPPNTVRATGCRIRQVDRANKKIFLEAPLTSDCGVVANDNIYIQKSKDQEIFGLPYVFDNTLSSLYGNQRSVHSYLLAQTHNLDATFTTDAIQIALDRLEETAGSTVDLILASFDVRRKYLTALQATRTNIDYMNLDGGFKALAYNGIPVYVDRFVDDNCMFCINTKDFKMVQLEDWKWIEDDGGRVLRQLDNRAVFGATLVKYANLICTRPIAQLKVTNIN